MPFDIQPTREPGISRCVIRLGPTEKTPDIVIHTIRDALRAFHKQTNPNDRNLEFRLTRELHRIVASGTFKHRIEYINLVGLRDEIWRQQQFRDAVQFFDSEKLLQKIGVRNILLSFPPHTHYPNSFGSSLVFRI